MYLWWKKWNSDQCLNNHKCQWECKKRFVCEKDYIWNRDACSCENGQYLVTIMDDSAIMCDEIIDAEAKLYNLEKKTFPTKFNEKKQPLKHKICKFSLTFLLITKVLLRAVNIYCYFLKKHLF